MRKILFGLLLILGIATFYAYGTEATANTTAKSVTSRYIVVDEIIDGNLYIVVEDIIDGNISSGDVDNVTNGIVIIETVSFDGKFLVTVEPDTVPTTVTVDMTIEGTSIVVDEIIDGN